MTAHHVRFHDVALKVVDHDGKPWLTGPDIARALGYNRSDKVAKIYNRRRDEFAPDMSCLIKIDTPVPDNPKMGLSGNLAPRSRVRIYSARGAHLIAMFAETDRAKQFRRWVLDVLEREIAPPPDVPALVDSTAPMGRSTVMRGILEVDCFSFSRIHTGRGVVTLGGITRRGAMTLREPLSFEDTEAIHALIRSRYA